MYISPKMMSTNFICI